MSLNFSGIIIIGFLLYLSKFSPIPQYKPAKNLVHLIFQFVSLVQKIHLKIFLMSNAFSADKLVNL
jgi:hypothetical protein